MSLDVRQIRLRDLPYEMRVVLTFFVALVSFGYGVAVLNLYFTYAPIDGRPGLSVADFQRSLLGNRDNTTLGRVLQGGSMEQYMKDPAEKGRVLSWIQDGTRKEQFGAVEPIFKRNCVACHQPGGPAGFRPLRTYEEVLAVAQIDRGETLPTWARVAHTHVQSLALVYLALGLIFTLCTLPSRVKTAVVCTPFVALFLDFGARGLARFSPGLMYVTLGAGGLMSLATAVMTLVILRELWVIRPRRGPLGANQPGPP